MNQSDAMVWAAAQDEYDKLVIKIEEQDKTIQLLANALKEAAGTEEYACGVADKYYELAEKYLNAEAL